jgi:hypothetical protein
MRVAFFALLFDQPLDAPIHVFARDEAGNEAVAALDNRVFPKAYQKSRIEIDDKFLGRVVPAIAGNSPLISVPQGDLLGGFLLINGELRRANNQYIAELAKKSSPELMFMDAFQQLGDSQVEAKFADTRTYVYKGKDVDKQVHLGFDLAVTANVPIKAAQRGVIVHAAYLGIYGNCVDHRPRHGRAVALRPPVVDRREGGRQRGQGPGDRPQRHDRAGRRRPPPLHDARRRPAGDAGGLVEQPVDGRPRASEDQGRGRPLAVRATRRPRSEHAAVAEAGSPPELTIHNGLLSTRSGPA